MLRDLGAQGLTQAGHEVTTAVDGEQALGIFTETSDRFAPINTDLHMPRLSGSDLIVAVRRLRPEQPVIVCTGQLATTALPGLGDAERLAKP